MTQAALPISYASPITMSCPLCRKRPVATKRIYNHPVCKKCYYAFANRRQLAYLLDSVIFALPAYGYSFVVVMLLAPMVPNELVFSILVTLAMVPLTCVFLMKDGFGGKSVGKLAADLVVLDDPTGRPIGFGQSFKRNSILLTADIPILGRLLGIIFILTIAFQVARGYRLGDRFAGTKVIWKKYAHLPVFGGNALVCESCGYNLHGNTSGTCPECGTPVSEHNAASLAASASGVFST